MNYWDVSDIGVDKSFDITPELLVPPEFDDPELEVDVDPDEDEPEPELLVDVPVDDPAPVDPSVFVITSDEDSY